MFFKVQAAAINNYLTVEAADQEEAVEIALNFVKEDLPDADTYEILAVSAT